MHLERLFVFPRIVSRRESNNLKIGADAGVIKLNIKALLDVLWRGLCKVCSRTYDQSKN